MHPIIEEFNRVYSLANLQPQAFRRMQRVLRDEVQPMLDERERLIEENARLTEENRQLTKKLAEPANVTVSVDGRAVAETVAPVIERTRKKVSA